MSSLSNSRSNTLVRSVISLISQGTSEWAGETSSADSVNYCRSLLDDELLHKETGCYKFGKPRTYSLFVSLSSGLSNFAVNVIEQRAEEEERDAFDVLKDVMTTVELSPAAKEYITNIMRLDIMCASGEDSSDTYSDVVDDVAAEHSGLSVDDRTAVLHKLSILIPALMTGTDEPDAHVVGLVREKMTMMGLAAGSL